jgi:hypothetical protein
MVAEHAHNRKALRSTGFCSALRALDRDLDGRWDGDELPAGSDPADITAYRLQRAQ